MAYTSLNGSISRKMPVLVMSRRRVKAHGDLLVGRCRQSFILHCCEPLLKAGHRKRRKKLQIQQVSSSSFCSGGVFFLHGSRVLKAAVVLSSSTGSRQQPFALSPLGGSQYANFSGQAPSP